MENERILELDHQIESLKSTNPEIYGWITLKDKQLFLQKELESNDPNKNSEENRKELQETGMCMMLMKKKYSSIQLYEAVVSAKKKLLDKT